MTQLQGDCEVVTREDPLWIPTPSQSGGETTSSSVKPATDSPGNNMTMGTEFTYSSTEELVDKLSQLHTVDLTAEDMDPLEWTVRKVIPIPEHYYWDVVPDRATWVQIPTRIRLWHVSIHAFAAALHWTEQRVATPVAKSLGLLSPRVETVTMFMDENDWKKSQRIVADRLENSQQQELAVDGETKIRDLDESHLSAQTV